jgi:hypothetical protein
MGRLELDKKIKISTETAYRFVLQDKAVGTKSTPSRQCECEHQQYWGAHQCQCD